jgi:ribosomal-protein-alanine N-acetyltransferase
MRLPVLESERLLIRPFTLADIEAVHDLLDVQLRDASTGTEGTLSLTERERWLRWAVLNEQALAYLMQPPYGDRAIVQRGSGQIVGACGYVPCFGPFGQVPSGGGAPAGHNSTEFGLYYAVAPAMRGQGIATEAARLLVGAAFEQLNLARVVATTDHDNRASIRVMERLGMRIEHNPYPEPHWFQVVGILDNPSARR